MSRARGSMPVLIDGDRDGDRVLFGHRDHVDYVQLMLGAASDRDTCGRCHHMNVPQDDATPCAICHSDMARATDIFDHDRHVAAAGGTSGCTRCHEDATVAKRRETAKPCRECHTRLVAPGSPFGPVGEDVGPAPGYVDAMHGLCVGCHREQVERSPVVDAAGKRRDDLAWCATCHRGAAVPLDPGFPDTPPAVDAPATTEPRRSP